MKLLGTILVALGMLLSHPGVGFAKTFRDGEAPFPLGSKAPLPWNMMDGYWKDWKGEAYFYRIEVVEVYKDGSRTVSVALININTNEVLASGLGFVRANNQDLWAHVTGPSTNLKFRLQSYFEEKDSTDMTKRALVVSLKDMNAKPSTELIRHQLFKVNSLNDRVEPKEKDHSCE